MIINGQFNKVVQVNLIEDPNNKRYTYNVPYCAGHLQKGQIVRVKNRNGKECDAICVTNSALVTDDALDMIMCGNQVLSNVIGVYRYESYPKEEKETVGDKT